MKDNLVFHYKLLKLINGESIVCSTDDNCENLRSKSSIHVCDPVLVIPFRVPRGMNIAETYIMTPWISISEEIIFEIPTEQIIVAVDLKHNFKENYISYVEAQNKTEDLVQQDKEVMLKHLLNSLGNNSDEEIEDSSGDKPILVPGSRSVH